MRGPPRLDSITHGSARVRTATLTATATATLTATATAALTATATAAPSTPSALSATSGRLGRFFLLAEHLVARVLHRELTSLDGGGARLLLGTPRLRDIGR